MGDLGDELREEERPSRPIWESWNIDLKRNEAPSENIQEAAADADEEDRSNHHQTYNDELVAGQDAKFMDEQKRIFGCFVGTLVPFAVEVTHSNTFHISDQGDSNSSSAMDVPLFDISPYDPGPFSSPPPNPIKLGFPESKMVEAYNHAIFYASEEEFCVRVKNSWFKQTKREVCLPCSEDSRRPNHYRDISYTKLINEYPMIDDYRNSFELSLVDYKCLGTDDKNNKEQNQAC